MKIQGCHITGGPVRGCKSYIYNFTASKGPCRIAEQYFRLSGNKDAGNIPGPREYIIGPVFPPLEDPTARLFGPHSARRSPTYATNRRISVSATALRRAKLPSTALMSSRRG
jgi:hypothetical protein